MNTILKGFPTEISKEIEMPSIAELILMPMFFDCHIDDVYKYGSDFHRKLIDLTPLRNNKKTVSVMSEVRFLGADLRSCTGNGGSPDKEWHIDCEENEDRRHIYHEDRDIVHLITNDVTSMTEFNENEIILPISPNRPFDEFMEYIYNNINNLGIKGRKMPSNKIVTFTNHMHRATNPSRPELKFMFRIVETDRNREPSRYSGSHTVYAIGKGGKEIENVYTDSKQVILTIPETIKNNQEKIDMNINQCESNSNEKRSLVIDELAWESTAVTDTNPLFDFTPMDSIMIISNNDFSDSDKNRELNRFFENVDRSVKLRCEDGSEIDAITVKGFFENSERPIAGSYISLTTSQSKKVKDGKVYDIIFDKNSNFHFKLKDGLKFKYPKGVYVEQKKDTNVIKIDVYDKEAINNKRAENQDGKVVIKGFPTEIGEHIELPDMAELLTYPMFVDVPIEEAYKYATDFQRKLINLAPIRGNKKYTTLYSQVKFLDPNHRSCTGLPSDKDEDKEWHIDTEEDGFEGQMNRYYEETDFVHLLTSKATSMTEFNLNEITLDFDPMSHTTEEFYKYLHGNIKKLGIIGASMPSNRFVTFTNHLHRATPSNRIEFKFMFRIVETDRERPPSSPTYNRDTEGVIMNGNRENIRNISQQEDKIIIHLPETISKSGIYLPKHRG